MKNAYLFGETIKLNTEDSKKLLGSKGYYLSQMKQISLPIPNGFTILSNVCNEYFSNPEFLNHVFESEIKEILNKLEKETGKIFGSKEKPLLLSVRSGSSVSMPGMMDTILNLGLNDEIVEGLSNNSSKKFAYNCYMRFIEMFSSIVFEYPGHILKDIKTQYLIKNNILSEDLAFDDMINIISSYKENLQNHNVEIPSNPYEQLYLAIKSVMNSWHSQRAKIYRQLNGISEDLGTAVTVQEMVFGNYDNNSATGVVFSRDPVSGENKLYGEFLRNAQGEDIVSGTQTPLSINGNDYSFEKTMPNLYQELSDYAKLLENRYKEMQDIEFTVESGKLYILQTRTGKRTITSSVKIAYDFVSEGLIDKKRALMMLDLSKIDNLLHPTISKNENDIPIAKGLAASPGAARGKIVFCSESAEKYSKNFDVILVRLDTCPEDIKGMALSKAILTARGGLTSHAAVVARGMGKPCITGINNMHISSNTVNINGHVLNELDEITIDGTTGEIFVGKINIIPTKINSEFEEILEWANEIKTINVRANAENANDIKAALSFGAEGIGLCRTEHMFFEKKKISLIRQMIISPDFEARQKILSDLLPLHMKDFVEIFSLLESKPVNIRLIDPPLHEFLPKEDSEIEELAKEMGLSKEFIYFQLERLHETNPMLGHRGARLGVTHPDIYQMQIKAILGGAIIAEQEGFKTSIEIMLPLISNEKELLYLKKILEETAEEVMVQQNHKLKYKLGTMIELPRAAIIADKISPHVDYFSFGTNDLTQTVYGISRDDISSFMPEYKSNRIFLHDPFNRIDEEGVGEIVKEAMKKGRSVKANLTCGICGEHGGDPDSIKFFNNIGMNYISCSPYRIPAARIAAAQAALVKESI